MGAELFLVFLQGATVTKEEQFSLFREKRSEMVRAGGDDRI